MPALASVDNFSGVQVQPTLMIAQFKMHSAGESLRACGRIRAPYVRNHPCRVCAILLEGYPTIIAEEEDKS